MDTKEKAAGLRTRAASKRNTHSYLRAAVGDAQAGKALAVWLYCIGARNLSATHATFARHPEWVAA